MYTSQHRHPFANIHKSSLKISLVLLGSVALIGCENRHWRYEYDKRENCVSDWGEMACKNRGHYYPSHHKPQNFVYCTSSKTQHHHAKQVLYTHCHKKVARGGFGSHFHKASS